MSQIDLNQLLQITKDIESGNQDQLSQIYSFLEEIDKNHENSEILLSSLYSNSFTLNQHFIVLTIIKNYNFPLEDPFLLIPLLSNENEPVFQTAAIIISRYITEEEQLSQIIQHDSIAGNFIPFLYLVLQVCQNGHSFNFGIHFAISFFCECDNDDTKLNVAEMISKLAPFYRKNEDLSEFYRNVFQTDLNEDNLLVIEKLLNGSIYALPSNELLNYLLTYFSNLTSEIPINYTDPTAPSLYTFVSKLALIIYRILHQYNEEEDENTLEFDENALIRACVLHCILGEERMAYLEENLEDFVVSLEEDNDDANIEENDFNSIRKICVKILNEPSFVKQTVDFCNEIMNESEIHEEAALFVLNGILPKHHMYDIDIPIPDDNNFCIGQYIKYLYYYQTDCSNSTISEALESDSFVLAIFAADSLSRSEYLFQEERISLTSILIGLILEFQYNNYGYLLNIIERLISFSPQAFEECIGDLLPTLFQLLCDGECVLNSELYHPICKIIEHLSDFPAFHIPILDFVSPYIGTFLTDENTVSCAFLMLKLFFCKDESIVSDEAFSTVIPPFFQSLKTFPLDFMDRKEIMEILFYAVRCGETEFPILFLTELLRTTMNSSFFIYLSSILYYLVTNIDVNLVSDLLNAIKERIESAQTSVLQEAICCLFSAVSSTHPQLIEPLLSAVNLNLETMLNLFGNWIYANSIIHPFDIKLCIACLLKYKDFQLASGQSILEICYKVLTEAIQFDSPHLCEQLAFSAYDPFYKNSPYRTQSYQAFINQISKEVPDFPQYIAEQLKSLL